MEIEYEELEQGDILKINGTDYEVLKVRKEADPRPDVKRGPRIRMFIKVELRKADSGQLFPTAFLKVYEDTGRIMLIDHKNVEKDKIKLKKKE